MKSVLCILGTRPEAIKMAPVIAELQRREFCAVKVLATGQHKEMLSDTMNSLGVRPDYTLDVMKPGQKLAQLTSSLISKIDPLIEDSGASLILAQGDTTSVMIASLLAFYRQIPFGHVEAGLRTMDLNNPFPEEFNRIVADRLASLHFAPTVRARDNLLKEGIAESTIYVTGNTVIDALLDVANRDIKSPHFIPEGNRLILVSTHRRESFGEPIKSIYKALRRLHDLHSDIQIVFPVHPNPNIRANAQLMLGDLPRVHLVSPLSYTSMVATMKSSYVVLTDSGGLQEEAPALGKPVLVLRNTTERPEAVEAGVAKLIGMDEDNVVNETTKLLSDANAYKVMSRGASPYGDGHASKRIVNVIHDYLNSL